MEFSNLKPEMQQSLLRGGKLIAHAANNYDAHLSTAEIVGFNAYAGYSDTDYTMLLCHACTAFVDEGTFHVVPVQVPVRTADDAVDVRMGAAAILLRRNYVSDVRANKPGTAWAEALFALQYGYERRLASGDLWDEYEQALHESALDALIAEHETEMVEHGAHF